MLKAFFGFLVFIVVILLLGLATSWFGLVSERSMAKYQEETRKQTYDGSREYNQGTNLDIARYCEQMHDTTRPLSSRKAVAALIRTTMSTYNGVLSDDNQTCVADAKGM